MVTDDKYYSHDPRRLLCISWEFDPMPTPMGIGTTNLLKELAKKLEVTVVTNPNGGVVPGVKVERVLGKPTGKIRGFFAKYRASWLAELLCLPDELTGWKYSAIERVIEIVKKNKPDVLLVNLMPYVDGDIAMEVRRRIPSIKIVTNFHDSPTCPDMHSEFASRQLFKKVESWEEKIAEISDAVVYVSNRTVNRIRDKSAQPRERFHLIRCASPEVQWSCEVASEKKDELLIVYTGGLSGWTPIAYPDEEAGLLKRTYRFFSSLGVYKNGPTDFRGHSPLYLAAAAKEVMTSDPSIKIRIKIIGDRYPAKIVQAALKKGGMEGLVEVSGPLPQIDARKEASKADALFMCRYQPLDGRPCHIMSCKTYDYLQSNLPILAALPNGEDRDVVEGIAGVTTVAPNAVHDMADFLRGLVLNKRSGIPVRFDRSQLAYKCSVRRRAEEFNELFDKVLSNHA